MKVTQLHVGRSLVRIIVVYNVDTPEIHGIIAIMRSKRSRIAHIRIHDVETRRFNENDCNKRIHSLLNSISSAREIFKASKQMIWSIRSFFSVQDALQSLLRSSATIRPKPLWGSTITHLCFMTFERHPAQIRLLLVVLLHLRHSQRIWSCFKQTVVSLHVIDFWIILQFLLGILLTICAFP